MKVQDFIDSKRDNVMALLNNGKWERAVLYVQAWTDCDEAEAREVVEGIAASKSYEVYKEDVKRNEEAIRAQAEKERRARALFASSVKPQKKRSVSKPIQKPVKMNLYLIDGDNHITTAIERIALVSDETDIIRIFVSQSGLFEKLRKKQLPHSQVILVPPGNQAVDNRIKAELGNVVKQNYGNIFVISHDKGYDDLIQKYRCQYHRNKDSLDRRELF